MQIDMVHWLYGSYANIYLRGCSPPFFFKKRHLETKGNIRELFISRSCAKFTPGEQEQDVSAGALHLYCPIQPNLSIRICSCRTVPAGITRVQAAATNNTFCGLEEPDKSLWRQRWHLLLLSLCFICPILPGTHFFLELIKKHVGKVAVSSTTGI